MEALELSHVAGSPMEEVLSIAHRIGGCGASAVIHGENGTGTRAIARLVHDSGADTSRPFVAVPCQKLNENDVTGALARAGGGTLFLQDLCDTPVGVQAALTHTLRTPARRMRIVASTAKDPVEELAAGRLRPDLLASFGCVLDVPPLRERGEDALVVFDRCWEALGAPGSLSAPARGVLARHEWPGNADEVRALATSLAATHAGGLVRALEVERSLLASARSSAPWNFPRHGSIAIDLSDDSPGIDLNRVVQQIEATCIA